MLLGFYGTTTLFCPNIECNGATMQFKGTTRSQQQASRELWKAWRRTVRSDSKMARFANRFVTLIEQRVGSPQPHVATIAAEILAKVNAEELAGRPLTPAQLREVILVLSRCWRHGISLRNWAVGQGYVERGDS
jgi:FAD/FMN-containing dehydrogenase